MHPGLPNSFFFRVVHALLYSAMQATFLASLILYDLAILIVLVFGEEYKSRFHILCTFLKHLLLHVNFHS
jgi:hypothetical protein